MLLIMAIQFFTVRVTLKYLGVEDYGIYNVVCGVTNVFTFLTHTMTSASQRFLAYELGSGDIVKLKRTFDTFVSLFTLCAFIGVLILGVVGYWFITTHLIIPDNRICAALFAFYFTLIALFVSVFVLPFNSLIIAHEDMKTFAYVSIVDAMLKLGVVYSLVIIPMDKLKLYSALMLVAYLFPSLLYIVFCFRKYQEVNFERDVDWSMSKKIVPFMSWNLIGGLSWMLCTQGLSILINLFFGPIANAAKAIADKVNGAINGFTNNFMMAVQPQIVKSYAVGEMKEMHSLIFVASKMSFFLMLVLTFPIIINADCILGLWLEEHDLLTTTMLQMVLLYSLFSALEVPINQAVRATGNIRDYQVYVGIITLMVIPLSYIFFKMGLSAYYGYIALMIVYGLAFLLRLYFLNKQIDIGYSAYCNIVLKRCALCLIMCTALFFLQNKANVIAVIYLHPVILWLVDAVFVLLTIFVLGLSKSDRKAIKVMFNKIKNKHKQ